MQKNSSPLKKSASNAGPHKGLVASSQALDDVVRLIDDGPREKSYLIEYLHRIQDAHRGISAQHAAALAQTLNLSQVEVFETAAFYHHFDVLRADEPAITQPTVRICDGLPCAMAGSAALLETLQASGSQAVRWVSAPCVGACDRAPVAVCGQQQVMHATVDSVNRACSASPSAQTSAQPQPPALPSFSDCVDGRRSLEETMAVLQSANLRGLGGAGFPAHKKWQFVRSYAGPRSLVVNADEGEPGTFKDRHYLEHNPWRFWEGVLIAAWAIEAESIYVYLRDEYHDLRLEMYSQLEQLKEYLRRKNGTFSPKIFEIRRGAGAYICGEESALIESIEGKRGLPRLRPPYVAQTGVFGRPTLVHNVETLYWIPEILQKGAQWWNSHGRNGRTGLRSFSVSGRVKHPGVKLAPAGISVRELIDEFCGGMADGHTLYGYLPGGASGGILPASLAHVPLDFDTLQAYGCFIGSAAVIVLSQVDRARDAALNMMQFFEHESCGQCTPCREGTAQAVKLMSRAQWDEAKLTALSHTMMDASICGLGQAAPNPMLCAMKYFPQEFVA